MNTIIQEAIAFAPTNAKKVDLARWIKAKWTNFSWEEAHYHALHVVLARISKRIQEMFVSTLDVEPDEKAICDLFNRSLSEDFDFVCDWIVVPKCKEDIEDLMKQNL